MSGGRRPVAAAVALGALAVCGWAVFFGSNGPPPERTVSSVAWSGSGRWLAAGTRQGRIAIWDQSRAGAPRQMAFRRGSLNDLQFSPDERWLAIAAGDLAVWAPGGGTAPRLLREDHENYGSARFSGDGQRLLTITGAGVMETLDAQTGVARLRICCSSIYGEAVFTPDGEAIANAGHWPGLWDAQTGRLIGRLAANREITTLRPIAFDGSRGAILMGSQDGRVYLWDLKQRRRMAVSPAQTAYVDALAVTADGWVIFTGFGREAQLWNPDSGERRPMRGARPTSNFVMGTDGVTLMFGTADGAIELWDVRTERRERAWKMPAE